MHECLFMDPITVKLLRSIIEQFYIFKCSLSRSFIFYYQPLIFSDFDFSTNPFKFFSTQFFIHKSFIRGALDFSSPISNFFIFTFPGLLSSTPSLLSHLLSQPEIEYQNLRHPRCQSFSLDLLASSLRINYILLSRPLVSVIKRALHATCKHLAHASPSRR